MPCPHHNIKIVQHSNHQLAVADAAYSHGDLSQAGRLIQLNLRWKSL